MSHRMPIDHVRKQHAVRFGKEVRKARLAKGLSRRALALQLAIGESALWTYESGGNLPRIETAQRLASGLGAPILVEIVLESRTGACANCGKTIVHKGGTNRRYCSSECQSIVQKIRDAKGTARDRAVAAERRRDLQQACIDAMCRACEPEGLCRDEDCPLRMVSPLPLALGANETMPVAPEPYGHAKRWANPEHRAAQGRTARSWWENLTPEERQAHAEKMRQARWKAA